MATGAAGAAARAETDVATVAMAAAVGRRVGMLCIFFAQIV